MSEEDRADRSVAAPIRGSLTVLLVEDQEDDRWLLAEAVRARGHAVVPCGSVDEAWERYLEVRPPLILLDLLLPGQDGLELARRIRAAPGGEWPVILVVTIKRDPAILETVLEAGADDYLAKPIEIPLLDIRLGVAERMVERQRARRATQDALAEKTREIRTLFDNLDEVFFSVDLGTGRLIQLSPGAERLLGPTTREEDFGGRDWREVIFPGGFEDSEAVEALEPGDSLVVHHRVSLEGKDDRWIEAKVRAEGAGAGGTARLDGVLSDVTERRRAREQLAARNQELATLYRISEVTLSPHSSRRAYEEVLEEIGRTTGFPVVFLAQHDPSTNSLELVASRGLDIDADEDVSLEVTGTLPGRTLTEGRPIVRNISRRDELGSPVLRNAGLRTWVAVPLSTGDDVMGIFVLADTAAWMPDERLVRWAGSLAGTIASFIDRTATQEALRENEHRFRSLAEKLQQANEELEAFAYSVSHDLRAPLRTMQGFAHTLLQNHGDRLDPEARDYVRRIIRSGQASEELISDLLAYSRLSSEELELGRVDLGAVVENVLEQAAADIEARDAEVTIEDRLPTVHGHVRVLEQVVTNLVANAVKFVPEGRTPRITIRAEEREGGLTRLWVEDNGIGVDTGAREKIFRVFERLDRDGVARPGTGIGLAIVRRGMQRIGGEAGVADRDGAEGAAFWIDLRPEPTKAIWRPWARQRNR